MYEELSYWQKTAITFSSENEKLRAELEATEQRILEETGSPTNINYLSQNDQVYDFYGHIPLKLNCIMSPKRL